MYIYTYIQTPLMPIVLQDQDLLECCDSDIRCPIGQQLHENVYVICVLQHRQSHLQLKLAMLCQIQPERPLFMPRIASKPHHVLLGRTLHAIQTCLCSRCLWTYWSVQGRKNCSSSSSSWSNMKTRRCPQLLTCMQCDKLCNTVTNCRCACSFASPHHPVQDFAC